MPSAVNTGIAGLSELPCPIPDQELDRSGALAEVHQEITPDLCFSTFAVFAVRSLVSAERSGPGLAVASGARRSTGRAAITANTTRRAAYIQVGLCGAFAPDSWREVISGPGSSRRTCLTELPNPRGHR